MGRISWVAQFRLLLWRNWLLLTRDARGTLISMLMPAAVFLLLSTFRGNGTTSTILTEEGKRDQPAYALTSGDFALNLRHEGGALLYSPRGNNTYVERIMDQLRLDLGQYGATPSSSQLILGFDNEEQVERYHAQHAKEVWAAVVFPLADATSPLLPCHVEYSLRFNGSAVPSTERSAEFNPKHSSTASASSSEAASLMANGISLATAEYITTGFLGLQVRLNQVILDVRAREQLDEADAAVDAESASSLFSSYRFALKRFPTTDFTIDVFHELMVQVGPLYLIMSFMPLLQKCVMQLVLEKEKRVIESMKMAGLADSAFAVGSFVTWLALAFIPITLISGISSAYEVYRHTTFGVFFTLLFLYITCLLLFAFLISTFFSRSKLAGQFASAAIFLIFVPQYFLKDTSLVGMLSPPIAFARGFRAIADAESEAIDLNLTQLVGAPSSTTTMGSCLAFLALDAFLLAFAAYYFENVVQHQYGQAKPWNFLCKCNDDEYSDAEVPASGGDVELQQNSRYARVPVVVSVPSSPSAPRIEQQIFHQVSPAAVRLPSQGPPLSPGIRLVDVHKVFDPRSFVTRCLAKMRGLCSRGPASSPQSTTEKEITHALRGLSLTIARGEITALLGQNSSGKTTSLSILSGLIGATSGRVIFEGLGSRQLVSGERGPLDLTPINLSTIREHLFVCPQSDIFFDRLTVAEHLSFYAQLKGVPPERLREHMLSKLEQLGLADKSNELAKDLSGGQRRKLAVAVAFMGVENEDGAAQAPADCRDIIMLDEPSSGVDPVSRRAIWELVRSYKQNRIIILTSHSMGEAEALADRIAIIQAGQLRCAGTTMYLKRQYSPGYRLEIVSTQPLTPEDVQDLTELVCLKVSGAERALTTQQLREHHRRSAPSAAELDVDSVSIELTDLSGEGPRELNFLLPLEELPQFASLFHELERESIVRRFHLQPDGISISLNSLEEIFFKVIEEDLGADGGQGSALSRSRSNTDENDTAENRRIMDAAVDESDSSGELVESSSPPPFSRVVQAVISKKLSTIRRDKKAIGMIVFFPVLYMLFGLLATLKGINTSLFNSDSAVDFARGDVPGSSSNSFDRVFPFGHAAVPMTIHAPAAETNWLHQILAKDADFVPVVANPTPESATQELDSLLSYLLEPMKETSIDSPYAALYAHTESGSISPTGVLPPGSGFNLLYNSTASHAAPMMVNRISSALLAATSGPLVWQVDAQHTRVWNTSALVAETCPSRSLHASSRPFPAVDWLAADQLHFANFLLAFLLVASVGQLPIHFGVQVLKHEKNDTGSAGTSSAMASNDKNNSANTNMAMLKFHGGAHFMQRFWLATWFGDLCLILIPIVLILIIFAAFGNTLLLGSSALAACTFLILFCAASIVYTYAWTYVFQSTENLQLALSLLYSSVTWVLFVIIIGYYGIEGVKERAATRSSTTTKDGSMPSLLADGTEGRVWLLSIFETDLPVFFLCQLLPSFALPWALLQLGLQNYLNEELDAICAVEKLEGVGQTGVSQCQHTSQLELFRFARLGGVMLALLAACATSWLLIMYKERYLAKWWRQYVRRSTNHGGITFSARLPQQDNGVERGQLVAPASPVPPSNDAANAVEPADVAAERVRVRQSLDAHGVPLSDETLEPISILDLTKRFVLAEPIVLPPAGLSPAALAQLRGAGIDASYSGLPPTIVREKLAVNNCSLGVRRGETFSLCGPNGGGKSTLINTLIGRLQPDNGQAFFSGVSCIDPAANPAFDEVSHTLGLVPQGQGLYDALTPMEHMLLYGRLKGLSDALIRRRANRFFRELQVEEHANSQTENLSGGTKRKVALCLSLIGTPRILLLDEPSTGVDVSSRRSMWRLLSGSDSVDRATILTTHQLEEAEILATRIGILINGSFKCLGTSRELKSRHGGGLELQVKLAAPTAGLDTHSPAFLSKIEVFIKTLADRARVVSAPVSRDGEDASAMESEFDLSSLPPLPGFPFAQLPDTAPMASAPSTPSASSNQVASVQLLSHYNGLLTFALPSTPSPAPVAGADGSSPSSAPSYSFSLSIFFAYMQLYSGLAYGVADWTLNASTLDQLFVKLAREQVDSD